MEFSNNHRSGLLPGEEMGEGLKRARKAARKTWDGTQVPGYREEKEISEIEFKTMLVKAGWTKAEADQEWLDIQADEESGL